MLQSKFQISKFYQSIRVTSITQTSLVVFPISLSIHLSAVFIIYGKIFANFVQIVGCDSSTTDFRTEILVMCNFSLLCFWPQISLEWSTDLRSGFSSRSLLSHVWFKPVIRHRSLAAAVFGQTFFEFELKKHFLLVLLLSLWDILNIVKFTFYWNLKIQYCLFLNTNCQSVLKKNK